MAFSDTPYPKKLHESPSPNAWPPPLMVPSVMRQAAAGSEHRSDRPTSQHVAHKARLRLVEVGLIDEEQVVNEPAVERLVTIARPEVERIRRRRCAGGLHFRAGAERLATR